MDQQPLEADPLSSSSRLKPLQLFIAVCELASRYFQGRDGHSLSVAIFYQLFLSLTYFLCLLV